MHHSVARLPKPGRRDGVNFVAASFIRLALVALLTAVSLAGHVHAQDEDDSEARALFDAGEAAYAAGRFDAALSRFQEAYELSHRPIILWNIALAADRARQDTLALETYRRFLDEVPESPAVHDLRLRATARMEVLARTVAEAEEAEESVERAAEANRLAEERAREAELEREHAREAELEAERAREDAERARAEAREAEDSSRVANKWWFWTIVGVGVAGAVAVPVTIAGSRSSGDGFPETDHGNIVFAIRGTF